MIAGHLSPLGDLSDPDAEQRFRDAQFPLAARQARRNALIAGCAYMSGAVPFGWAFGLTPAYHVTNVGRLLVLIACLVLALHPATARDRRALERASVVVAVVAALALLPISALTPLGAHGNGTLAVAVMVVVALFVEVPIRWAVGVVSYTAVQTLAVNHWVLDTAPADAGLVAIVVVAIGMMSVLAAARLGATQRRLVASLAGEHDAQREAERQADQRTRAETGLRDRERALLDLVEHAPLPLVVVDSETGRMVAANGELKSLLDIPPDAHDVSLHPFLSTESRARLRAALGGQQAVSGMNVSLISRTGRAIDARVAVVLTAVAGRPCSMVSVLDLTAEREHARTLEQAREAADASSKAKSEFLAHMSHEIRTPMNGVLGLAELILDTDLTFDQREMVRTIRSSGELLLAVINGILDLSKVESATFELEQREFDPVESLERSFEPLALKGRDKGLSCGLSYGAGLPPMLLGDEVRVCQVFNNLVGNAIKFTERGEVTVHVDAASEGTRQKVSVIVRDTGIGIDAATLSALFAPFRQADASTTRKYGGTGLGLHITRQLCRQMDGDVVATSVPGEGTTFAAHMFLAPAAVSPVPLPWLQFEEPSSRGDRSSSLRPLFRSLGFEVTSEARPDAIHVVRASAQHHAVLLASAPGVWLRHTGDRAAPAGWIEVLAPWSRRTLGAALSQARRAVAEPSAPSARAARQSPVYALVADDNAVNRKVLVRMLARLGVACDVVNDGAAAVRALRGRCYDVVFMDVQMPVMDGLAATQAWRHAEGDLRRTPIVAVTAHAMADHRKMALEAGMDDVITKPVNVAALDAALRRWVAPEIAMPASA